MDAKVDVFTNDFLCDISSVSPLFQKVGPISPQALFPKCQVQLALLQEVQKEDAHQRIQCLVREPRICFALSSLSLTPALSFSREVHPHISPVLPTPLLAQSIVHIGKDAVGKKGN